MTKTIHRRSLSAAAALLFAAFSQASLAEMTADEAARLGADLTPIGAEKAGNADGSIPAWDGGITKAPAGFVPAKGYLDPYAAEKPLFTITAANMKEYADKLAPGQVELLKRYPSFKIPVYPSHRSAALPQSVYDLAKSEGMKAKIAEGGRGLINVEKTNVPFPIPKNGEEVIWNHLARYLGGAYQRYTAEFPVQASGRFTPVTRVETMAMPGAIERPDPNMLYYYISKITGPSNVAGEGVLVQETLDQNKEARRAWLYNPGSRRVLRAPEFAYDAPGTGADGLRTVDDYQGFTGITDRYDWKLIGKKEMYVPYNSFKLTDKSLKYSQIIQPTNVNSDLTRYELHRVWVVEATLKKGMRHIYAKRVFFIDEDSWTVVHADQYDGRGELWRVHQLHLTQFYDVPMPWFAIEALYDLQARRYLASGVQNEEPPHKLGVKLTGASFSTEAFRRQGR